MLSPALGYVGQGMIMGPRTAVSMLAGALAGWACLGPFAHAQGAACPHVVPVLLPGLCRGSHQGVQTGGERRGAAPVCSCSWRASWPVTG